MQNPCQTCYGIISLSLRTSISSLHVVSTTDYPCLVTSLIVYLPKNLPPLSTCFTKLLIYKVLLSSISIKSTIHHFTIVHTHTHTHTHTYTHTQIIHTDASCSVNNGGCEHQCSSGSNGALCSCRNGYRLRQDGKHCSG